MIHLADVVLHVNPEQQEVLQGPGRRTHRPLEDPEVVVRVWKPRQRKVTGANESVLGGVSLCGVCVVAKCKCITKKVVAHGTGAGIHQDEDGNVLGKPCSHAPNGKLQ